MKAKAVRIYGKKDLRLETLELPEIRDDEILAQVVSDSICMSSYKLSTQGSEHKRAPKNLETHPIIVGHEFCGRILKVGKKWEGRYREGSKFAIQPALNYKGSLDAPGYSYPYIGGDSTHVVIPQEVMLQDCLLDYSGDAYFYGSLSEPMSCIVGAFHAQYHTVNGSYEHKMDIVEGGNMLLLAGVGPMGLGAIDYAIHRDRRPGLLVVVDIDEKRLKRAESLYPPAEAAKNGVKLLFVNSKEIPDLQAHLMQATGDKGFDDVFVFAAVKPLVEAADKLLGRDGCLNFFAGPTDPAFSAAFNFYNVHYNSTHVVGTSGGNTSDMIESLQLMSEGRINPAVMITHIAGLNAVPEITNNLPQIPGGKKLIYTNIDLPLTAIEDFRAKGAADSLFAKLADIVEANNGLWCLEAERYLLDHAKGIL